MLQTESAISVIRMPADRRAALRRLSMSPISPTPCGSCVAHERETGVRLDDNGTSFGSAATRNWVLALCVPAFRRVCPFASVSLHLSAGRVVHLRDARGHLPGERSRGVITRAQKASTVAKMGHPGPKTVSDSASTGAGARHTVTQMSSNRVPCEIEGEREVIVSSVCAHSVLR